MTERKTSDILVRIEKNSYGDLLDLRIWYNGFETSYPGVQSFLDGLHENIRHRYKEVKSVTLGEER